MSSRRNRQSQLDFEIHIDPSCAAMEDPPVVDILPSEEEVVQRSSLGSDFSGEGSISEPNWVSHEEISDSEGTEPAEDFVEAEHKISGKTEAEIRAAARAALQKGDSSSRRSSHRSNAAASDDSFTSPRNSMDHSANHTETKPGHSRRTGSEGGGSNSSHHEHSDDVFSDNSPRSSMGSMPDTDQQHRKTEAARISDSFEPKRSAASRISDIQPYDPEEEFVPTLRGTPRPVFRSPSAFKTSQTHSPPPSISGGSSSSRQGKRTPRTSLSKITSPSTQYSPKKTPPRFKRNTPPLVLLHVTLLPLRWPWGHVVENARPSELSEAGKSLREAWRQLQDRVGDTVSDRGVLLPHPQNDFEVLEERFLEAVELPLRRRARILECGHYLGPANEMSLVEDVDDDDDDSDSDESAENRQQKQQQQQHWCTTCRSDIRYDSLGEGKVFRTKVYASNGLMRAGAWDACWKQMERVDIEVEPIVDDALLDELEQLAAEQERLLLEEELKNGSRYDLDHDDDDVEDDEEEDEEEEAEDEVEEETENHTSEAPIPDDAAFDSTPLSAGRRQRDEERLREIYGQSPPESTPKGEEFIARETPPSPTVEAMDRRDSRRQTYKAASLPELVVEAAKVFFRDRKNAAIAVLGVLVMMLALRGGGGKSEEMMIYQAANEQTAAPIVDAVLGGVGVGVAQPKAQAHAQVQDADPCLSCSVALESAKASSAGVVTITVTETIAAATATPTVESIVEQLTAETTEAEPTVEAKAEAKPAAEAESIAEAEPMLETPGEKEEFVHEQVSEPKVDTAETIVAEIALEKDEL